MSTKLRNIDAIKKMLDGSHRTQTKTSIGYQKNDAIIKREIGEVWIDENGDEWIQEKGFKIKKGKLDEIRSLIESRKMPSKCPKCDQPMNKRLDKKFWVLEKHCFDCQVAFEHNLRIEGKYEAYEKNKVLQNAEAWLKDAEQEAKILADAFRNPLTYANADGTLETWQGDKTPEEMADIIELEFLNFKENFINKLKQDLNLVNQNQNDNDKT